jgi:hypothetical protein
MKRHIGSFRHAGPQRGATHSKEVMVHKGNIWSLYKNTKGVELGKEMSKES